MNCTSNNLPCPTPRWCAPGCYFTEADTPYQRAMNAPIHTRNGGRVIGDGMTLEKPVYVGNDVIDYPLRRKTWIFIAIASALWVAAMSIFIYRLFNRGF